ncbi:MAG: T9SS type A sorting domain-containing protein [Chitinispirillaceae bacterium]|nr:T9SS type A sorting domain-containing protein [Chitinispirillaceae bacterium]
MWFPELLEEQTGIKAAAPPHGTSAIKISTPGISGEAKRKLVISGISSEGTVSLVSLSGKQVLQKVVTQGTNAVDISSIVRGCYLFRYSNASNNQKVSLIISIQ